MALARLFPGLSTASKIFLIPLCQKICNATAVSYFSSVENASCEEPLHPEVLQNLNCQINEEYQAFYTYLSMACYFGRSSIELPGCRKFFLKQVREEEEHATLLIDYANCRGGIVELQDIRAPKVIDWCSPLNALQNALELEMSVTKKLKQLHQVGDKHNDYHLCDFIDGTFLTQQVKSEHELRKLITVMKRLGDSGIGIHLFDLYNYCKNDAFKLDED
ncbi:ferritin heavy chain-like [Schistocerca gregaria]|uniref:ferritin heavy chain-like n=1 Tax=Schistocerca gregaria TaxID=7010 RepID=UPI00211E025D|nr:ferritin heavy chain-like [Schistocerca gregaria]